MAATQSCGVCPSVRLSVRPSVCMSVRLSVFLSTPLSTCNSQHVGEAGRTRYSCPAPPRGVLRVDCGLRRQTQCKNSFPGGQGRGKRNENKEFTVTMYCISLRDLYIYLGLKDCLLVFTLLQPVDLIVCQSITLQCIYIYKHYLPYLLNSHCIFVTKHNVCVL